MALGLVSCLRDYTKVNMPQEHIRVEVKTASVLPEDKIRDINVYAYHDGYLYNAGYFTGTDISLELNGGTDYTIYALANVGKVDAPIKKDELKNIRCDLVYPGYMPMCLSEGQAVNLPCDGSVRLVLTRLMSKISLCIKNKLDNCSFDLNSVQLMQTPVDIAPFVGSNAMVSGTDGQAASPEQLEALRNGEYVDLYMFENCQGILLASNTDPSKKTPDVLGEEAKRCSYLDIKGKWTTDGAQADSEVRFYLGRDNCKDFNVFRNTNIRITLSLTDAGMVSSSWKAELSNVEDERSISLPSEPMYIFQGEDWEEVPMEITPSNMNYVASIYTLDGKPSPDMECEVRNGRVYLRGIYSGMDMKKAILSVCSWDYMQEATLEIRLAHELGEFCSFESHIPVAIGEWGYVKFLPKSSEDIKLTLEATGEVWRFGINRRNAEAKKYVNVDCAYELYAFPKSDIVYIHKTAAGLEGSFELRQGPDMKVITIPKAVKPMTKGSGFYTESGCLKQGEDGDYYDSDIYVGFGDIGGQAVDVRDFRIPDEVLEYSSLALTPENAYRGFEEMYPDGSFSREGINDVFEVYAVQDANRYEGYDNGYWRHLRIYGKGGIPKNTATVIKRTFMYGQFLGQLEISYRAAFPSQRHIGNVFNYSIAPGSKYSITTDIDFTEGGKYEAPVLNCVSWQMKKVNKNVMNATEYNFVNSAVTGNKYMETVSMSGGMLRFSSMNASKYPASGRVIVKGTVTNPHSNLSFVGYYMFDLVLYLSLGASFEYTDPGIPLGKSQLRICFVPYMKNQYPDLWKEMLPESLTVSLPHTNYSVSTPSKLALFETFRTKYFYNFVATIPNVLEVLAPHKDELFTFTINAGELTGQTEYLFDRNTLTGDEAYGAKGYYYVVRQYDEQSITESMMPSGMDNYTIQAAYNISPY